MNFADDAEAGLHSSNFNLAENIEAEDSRRGLDENAKQQVYRIMKARRVGFDEEEDSYSGKVWKGGDCGGWEAVGSEGCYV